VIGRKNLLEKIDSAIELQKRIVLHLNRHIASAVTHGSLEEVDKKEILEKFQSMAITHTKHSALLAEIKEEIQSGDSNVY
jgi:hypothetical protein